MVLVGIAISFLMKLFFFKVTNHPPHILHHIVTIIITIVIWEGNLWIDHWMNKHYPWVSHTKQRILFHLPAAFLYSSVTLFSLITANNYFICDLNTEGTNLMVVSLVISLIISFMLLSIEISTQLLRGWKNSLIEVEKYKTESVQAQLQNLKDQINPHFLFNNLSVLSSLVYQDQDKAVDFINQLSKVYRYLLDNRSNELVRLEEELKFIDSYMYLLNIRFDKNISFVMNIDQEMLHKLIPPMSLQMLIENAIKHNEISSEHPLRIDISTKDKRLIVSNNFQPRRETEPSSKTGLKNIRDRYHYFTDQIVDIESNMSEFIVRIPLLA